MVESFWLPFRALFRRSTFWCILVALWLTFGFLLAPLGCLFAPSGSLLAPFGSLLSHFWCPLAHFSCPWAQFCSPWRSISSLLGSPGVILNIFRYFRWKSHVKSYFFEKKKHWKSACFFSAFQTLSAKHPKTIPGTWTFASLAPGAELFLWQAGWVNLMGLSVFTGSAESRSVNNFRYLE